MCELLAMSCRHPARLTSSLTALASHAQGISRNRDGWGLAFYQDRDVALYRGMEAADTSSLVQWLEEYGPLTGLSLGYIRHATQGDIKLANTGPFIRELNGRIHCFAHNGNLTQLDDDSISAPRHFQPVGDSDSELAFCYLLARIEKLHEQHTGFPPFEARLKAVAEIAVMLRNFGPANFLYADGDTLFAHADRRMQPSTGKVTPPGLYLLQCPTFSTSKLLKPSQAPHLLKAQRAVLFASVPLTDENWVPLTQGAALSRLEMES